ncbi:MAG: hypothetical protein M1115_11275, partial [Actinobacteria bacterium]|nr:hypothetical protein [Actinomycetota bacterium]
SELSLSQHNPYFYRWFVTHRVGTILEVLASTIERMDEMDKAGAPPNFMALVGRQGLLACPNLANVPPESFARVEQVWTNLAKRLLHLSIRYDLPAGNLIARICAQMAGAPQCASWRELHDLIEKLKAPSQRQTAAG